MCVSWAIMKTTSSPISRRVRPTREPVIGRVSHFLLAGELLPCGVIIHISVIHRTRVCSTLSLPTSDVSHGPPVVLDERDLYCRTRWCACRHTARTARHQRSPPHSLPFPPYSP